MKIIFNTTILFLSLMCLNCKQNNVQKSVDIKLKFNNKKDTLIRLNDTLSLYYASYNKDLKLWYNLSIVNKNDSVRLIKRSDYFGVGSELFHSLSPNAKYAIVDGIIKGYVQESEKDSILHENYTCAIIDLKKIKIISQIQEDCDGSWNAKNQWVSSNGKVVFDGNFK